MITASRIGMIIAMRIGIIIAMLGANYSGGDVFGAGKHWAAFALICKLAELQLRIGQLESRK